MLNFTRSWGFGILRVYWVSKSKCIISSNLRAEGSSGKVLNVVIFVESVVHRSNWRSRETETVGNSRERPGVIMPNLSIRHFFAKKLSAQSHFFGKCNGKQLEAVGARTFDSAKKSYLKPFKVHFFNKLVLNSSFFAESKVRAPTASNCFPLHFPKKDCAESFFAKKWRIDKFGMITPGRSRLFPTVSVSLERQLDLWTTGSTKITTFNTFPDDPSARRSGPCRHPSCGFIMFPSLNYPKLIELVVQHGPTGGTSKTPIKIIQNPYQNQ